MLVSNLSTVGLGYISLVIDRDSLAVLVIISWPIFAIGGLEDISPIGWCIWPLAFFLFTCSALKLMLSGAALFIKSFTLLLVFCEALLRFYCITHSFWVCTFLFLTFFTLLILNSLTLLIRNALAAKIVDRVTLLCNLLTVVHSWSVRVCKSEL